jgi:transposase InsO family protein
MRRNLRPSHTNSFSRKPLLPTRPSATKHSPNNLGVLFAGKITNPRDLKKILKTGSKRVRIKDQKIRSDNGIEFKNSQIEGFLEEEGIKHEFSSPYTPQQNGIVERKNRTLLDMARTMLDEYKTLDWFWAEAINIACYSINRLYLH